MSTTLREQTIVGLRWNTGAHLVRQVLQFAISVLLARLLLPEDFGLLGMIVIFTGFAALLNDLGFASALIQRREVTGEQLSSAFWLNLGMGLFLSLIFVASASLIAQFYSEPRLVPLTMLIAVNFILGSLSIVQSALLSRALAFRSLAVVDILSTIIAGTLAILLAYLGYGVYALAWQTLAATATAALLVWMIADWRPQLSLNWNAIRDLLGYSGNLLGFNVFNYWVRSADNLLIGKFIGTDGLGVYTRAYSTMLLPISQVSVVISRVMFPALSRLQDDRQRVKRIYLRSIGIISLVTFPMMLGLLVVADHFVLALYGPQWRQVIPILRILCIVGLMQSIGTTVGWIYQSQGRTDWMFRWGIVSGVLTVAAFVIGIRWGVMGVAIAYMARNFMLTYFNFMIPGKLINMSFSDVLQAVTGNFACGVAMATTVWVIGFVLPAAWPHWVLLSMKVSVGIIVYVLLIHLLRLTAYLDLRSLLLEQWQHSVVQSWQNATDKLPG